MGKGIEDRRKGREGEEGGGEWEGKGKEGERKIGLCYAMLCHAMLCGCCEVMGCVDATVWCGKVSYYYYY